jgi:ABC-2 type transport system ATP-binding protein
MIDIRDLQKTYGQTRALKGISASIARGEVVGLLGPNGAGKTTAMKIMVGFLLPTAGSVTVAGYDVTAEPLRVQERIGYLPENAPLYHDMLAQEYLQFTADMRGLEGDLRKRRLAAAVEQCGIAGVQTRPIGHLSKGYRQRVGLAGAILHDPEILILDEPTSGLDPNQIVEVRDLIRRMGETKTVILSTHILPEVEATCGRALILIDGVIRADGPLADLTRSHAQVLTAAVPNVSEALAALRAVRGVRAVASVAAADGFHTFRLELDGASDVGEALAALAQERRWRLRELRRDDRSLEQVFRELTETAGETAEVAS